MKTILNNMTGYPSDVRPEAPNKPLSTTSKEEPIALLKTTDADVQLSDEASFLKKIQADLANIPVVDRDKVAAARLKIAQGTLAIHQVDTQQEAFLRIADTLLSNGDLL